MCKGPMDDPDGEKSFLVFLIHLNISLYPLNPSVNMVLLNSTRSCKYPVYRHGTQSIPFGVVVMV